LGGDVVTGSKTSTFDQRGQTVRGAQTIINGDARAPVLSGRFDGPTAAEGGEAVDLRGSRGGVYKPSGDVRQHYGDSIRITGDGNVIGDNSRSTVIKSQTGEVTPERFQALLAQLHQAVEAAALDDETRSVVVDDLRTVETQIEKEQPRRAIVLSKLQSVLGLLATADGVWGIAERALPLARQAVDWAQALF
jgi:hypothetical protein